MNELAAGDERTAKIDASLDELLLAWGITSDAFPRVPARLTRVREMLGEIQVILFVIHNASHYHLIFKREKKQRQQQTSNDSINVSAGIKI